MHCLVTGGAGLIGSHIVDKLLSKGYEVTILDNLDPQTHPKGKPSWIPNDVNFIEGDVTNYDDVSKALSNVNVISHQAAFGGFTNDISYYFDVNTTGTSKLFEVIREEKINIEKFVVASSQAIFGEGLYKSEEIGIFHPQPRPVEQLLNQEWEMLCPESNKVAKPVPFDENLEPLGVSPYALSKYFEEKIALTFGKTYDIPVAALRYAVTYGPRQSIHNPYTGVFSIFSTLALNNQSPLIFEDGKQMRDFIYVEDVADANLVLIESDLTTQECFNVGTGKGQKVLNIANKLCEKINSSVEPSLSGEFRYGDSRHFIQNSSKLRKFSWEPIVEIDEGINKYVDWFLTNEKVDSKFGQASDHLREIGVIQKAKK